jgi:protocatechuate 3,4-dioxygenase, alpha subunit
VSRTPSQTVGPFYAIGLCRHDDNVLDPGGIELAGSLLDGRDEPIGDGMVEVWDAAGGRWGRSGTAPDGGFAFRVPRDCDVLEAYVFARGLLRHQRTRIYLREVEDEVLAGLAPEQRATLLAAPLDGGLRFDIRMQGERQTVFFEH